MAAVARLLQTALDAIDDRLRKERVANHDAQYAAIEADPVRWMCDHFHISLPKQLPSDAGETGEANAGGFSSITLPRQSAERLSKYILDLERGYER